MPGFNRRQRLPCVRRCRPCATYCGTAIWSAWCRFASPPPVSRCLRHINKHSGALTMARRSTVRRVEDFILFDVLYEDGTRTSNRKIPGSELVDIDADLLAKTFIEAQKLQTTEISGSTPAPIESFTRVRRR